jgi:hypothetical protein
MTDTSSAICEVCKKAIMSTKTNAAQCDTWCSDVKTEEVAESNNKEN